MLELPIVPGRGLVTKLSTQLRLDYLESAGITIDKIANTQLDFNDVQNKIESFIGSVEIPMGLVGPIVFKDTVKEELVYCAAGTLEGALVASMNRGAKAISLSGGFSAEVAWQKMGRAPMFLFENIDQALRFCEFTTNAFLDIKKIAESYSNHAKLIAIDCVHINEAVHLKFMYATGDASGQNMTTTCTWHAMLYIAERFKLESGIVPIDFVIEGNGSSDKKISNANIQNGRGVNVTASCLLTEAVIQNILRTTSEKLLRCFGPSKTLAKQDGMVGYNINVANAIAAIYIATGQDLASIHESAVGILHIEKAENGLQMELTLPNLVIGTVGGGTLLPKQSQALEMMDCHGVGKIDRFAKLIAGFALGLEISTYAAIVSGEFAKAHEKLGRNKPVKWLLRSELTPEFITKSLHGFFADKEILDLQLAKDDVLENGIITTVAARISKKLIGFIPFTITYKVAATLPIQLRLLIKSKPLDEEVIKGLHIIAASIDPGLSDLLKQYKENLEYKNCHVKEIKLYTVLDAEKFTHIPAFYGSYCNDTREIYYFIQEFLDYSQLKIINSENHPELWTQADILNVIEVITQFHQKNFSADALQIQEFKPWLSVPLYKKLLTILINERPHQHNVNQLNKILASVDGLQDEAENIPLPKTIIHNDFNTRNIAITKNNKPIIYDWELAVVDFPHRDIVEFLSFVLPSNFDQKDLLFYLQHHYNLYENVDWQEWLKAYRYSLKVYIISRVSFYEVSGILIKYEFSERILQIAFRMLEILENHA